MIRLIILVATINVIQNNLIKLGSFNIYIYFVGIYVNVILDMIHYIRQVLTFHSGE